MNEPDLLPRIEPPPGGLARLRARLDREERRGARLPMLLAAAALAAIALWLAIPSRHAHPAVPVPLARTVAPPLPDPSISPDFYWVASRPVGDAPPPSISIVTSGPAPAVTFRAP